MTNGHFKQCNDWLAERYGPDEVIDWNLTANANTGTRPAVHIPHTQLDMVKSGEKKAPEAQPVEEDNKTAKESKVVEEFEDDADALEALAETEANS